MTTNGIGARLYELRTKRALTQRALAEPRYTAAYVSSVESGRRVPSGDALAYFAARLEVSPHELRTGEPPGTDVRIAIDLATADGQATDDPDAADAVYRRVVQAVDDDHWRARCHVGLGRTALHCDRPDAAEASFEEADRLLADALPFQRAEAVAGRAACLRRHGDARYAAYLLADVRDQMLSAGYPDPGALLAVHAQLAMCLADLADEDRSVQSAAGALALTGPGDPQAVADMHLAVARTLLAGGRLDDAMGALDRARFFQTQAAFGIELAWCRLVRGRASARGADLTAAVADLEVAYEVLSRPGGGDDGPDAGIELAEVYHALGRDDEAGELLDAVDAAGAHGTRAARVAGVRALLATARGDLAGAERSLARCVDIYRAEGPAWELATAALRLAELLGRQDRSAELVDVMHSALVDIESLTERKGSG